jgi:DNA replication protein DnaC
MDRVGNAVAERVGTRLMMGHLSALGREYDRMFADMEARMQAQRMQRLAEFDGDCTNCFDRTIVCDHCERGRDLKRRLIAQDVTSILRAGGVPIRFMMHTFESFPNDSANAFASFMRDFDNESNALIIGRYGVGKTGLLAAALRSIAPRYTRDAHELALVSDIRRTSPFWLVSSVALTDSLRAGYTDGTFELTMRRAKTCRVLAIDDLGAEKASEWVSERLFAIIDARYGDRLPTLATSNLNPDQLEQQIGERTMQRLLERGQIFVIDGPNLRGL